MARASRSHNCAPKLVFQMFNMAMNNAFVVYKELVSSEGGKVLLLGKAVRVLVHVLCQWGEPIRKLVATHPSHLQDMDQVDRHMMGHKLWNERKSEVMMPPPQIYHSDCAQGGVDKAKEEATRVGRLPLGGDAAGQDALGLKKVREKMCLQHVHAMHGVHGKSRMCNIYLCINTKNGVMVCCHVAYHKRNHMKAFLSDKRN